jgi:PmbA protein
VPTRRKALVEAGILKDYFYDTYTANKDSRASNGCAGRASFRGVPGPSSSNFYLSPGSISRDRLIADTRDGILVFEVMGMHMTDPISGEFSVGISGIAVQNGKLTHGVRGAMLSGNVLQMLGQIDAIADDLTFYGRLAAPTFRVPDLMVA